MSASLIIFSSTDGHTKTICNRIKSYFKNEDSVKIISLEDSSKYDLSNFDKIIIGASIRYGRHKKKVLDFVKKNKNILDFKKTAFFSVNVVARKSEKNTPDSNPYIKKFLRISKWKPKKIGVFAGKVDYPNYSFFDKYVIKLIMFITNGPTDTSTSYEFTNWQKVQQFSQEIDKL